MSVDCPGLRMIEEYFSGKLDSKQSKEIEEHFYFCERCSIEARKISDGAARLKIIKANPLLRPAWEKYGDRIEDFKCAGDKNKSIKEFETRNKRFRITLRPIECDNGSALLEIRALDNSRSKHILLYLNERMEKFELDKNGLACMMVNSDLNLDNLMVRYYND
jgi:hypothetical protein